MIFQEKHGYILKHKSEVFENFKKFKAFVEKENGLKIEAMRSDHGGELTSNEFQKYCRDHGIRRLLTVLRSLQQNAVVERKNKKILDMARSMLKSKRLKKQNHLSLFSTIFSTIGATPTP